MQRGVRMVQGDHLSIAAELNYAYVMSGVR